MGTTTALAPGLSRKLKKVLETRTDNPDLLASLNTLSTFYTDNTAPARRNLRSTIEKRSLSINHDFLLASDAAQQALDRVEEEVNSLAECCDKIAKSLSNCNSTTGDIITTTERLKQELEVTTQRQEIASCFLRDYQVSTEEINALREEELNENFFKALSHVQTIHANCKVLLRTHHQTECRRLGDTDNPEVSELLKMAVRCLRERPVLFKYCAEEVANMRHNALFRRFISALTRGGPGGMPRPIEALASERELVFVLLDPDAVVDTGPTARRFSKSTEIIQDKAEPDLTFVLDRIFEGVCRPFKVRVEQVLQSQPNLIISYKLSNTLEFYSHTVSDLLGRETALCNTLWALKDAAQKTFFDILKVRGEKLLRYPPLVAVDLSPPPAVREGVSVLHELIEIHDSMMVPASGKKPIFDPVISALLDPIIQICEQAMEAHRSKGSIESARRGRTRSDVAQSRRSSNNEAPSRIFIINCLCAIQQPLLRHDVASEYVKKLGTMIDNHMRSLVEKEVSAILSRCGLSNKMPLFHNSLAPLADMEETSPASLSDSLKAFFGLILGSDTSLPEFQQMQLPGLRSDACVHVARSLAEAYDVIYNAIMDPNNGYTDPRSLARHPPDQIRTILGI
uniref:Conserved oligomeric Golgi complex subunit 6 n=1 Tax=Cynara cardunculus var. scolymus TaxID=59895 RepID=A0A103Y372_CYNCS